MDVTFPDGHTRSVSGVIPRPGSSGATRDEWDRLVAFCTPSPSVVQYDGPNGYSGTTRPTVNLIAPALEWFGPSAADLLAEAEEYFAAQTAEFNRLVDRGAAGWLLVYDAPTAASVRFLTYATPLHREIRGARTIHCPDPYNMAEEWRSTSTPIAGLSSDWVASYELTGGGTRRLMGYSRARTRPLPVGLVFGAATENAVTDARPWFNPETGEWWPRDSGRRLGETVQAPAVTFDVLDTVASGATVLAPWRGSETAVNAAWRVATVA